MLTALEDEPDMMDTGGHGRAIDQDIKNNEVLELVFLKTLFIESIMLLGPEE